jgi:hypothetical protein
MIEVAMWPCEASVRRPPDSPPRASSHAPHSPRARRASPRAGLARCADPGRRRPRLLRHDARRAAPRRPLPRRGAARHQRRRDAVAARMGAARDGQRGGRRVGVPRGDPPPPRLRRGAQRARLDTEPSRAGRRGGAVVRAGDQAEEGLLRRADELRAPPLLPGPLGGRAGAVRARREGAAEGRRSARRGRPRAARPRQVQGRRVQLASRRRARTGRRRADARRGAGTARDGEGEGRRGGAAPGATASSRGSRWATS